MSLVREERFVRRVSLTSGRGTAWMTGLLSATTLICGIGCTICPSPFDYSGTVPGTADQNDFRVRNRGIIPIWQRPRPWPPVVSNKADSGNKKIALTPKASRQIVVADKKPLTEESNSILTTDRSDPTVIPATHHEIQESTTPDVSVAGFFKDNIPQQAASSAE